MNYEMARELKEAGFPQTTAGPMYYCTDLGEWTYSPDCKPFEKRQCGQHELLKRPTLEELIAACGEKFGALALDKAYDFHVKWYCCSNLNSKGEWLGPYGDGATPSEAVKNLWLALNQKKA